MAQYALPTSDNGTTNWTEQSPDGAADGSWFNEFDEGFGAGRGTGVGPDITTYWRSPTNPNPESIITNLASVTDPEVSTGHVLRVRIRKTADGRQLDVTIQLRQNTTVLATVTVTNLDWAASWQTNDGSDYTLSAAEADAITDYSALNVVVTGDVTGGGTGTALDCSTIELEVPDAPGVTVSDTTDVAADTVTGAITAGSVTMTDTTDVAGDTVAGSITAGSVTMTDTTDVAGDTLAGTITAGSVIITATADVGGDTQIAGVRDGVQFEIDGTTYSHSHTGWLSGRITMPASKFVPGREYLVISSTSLGGNDPTCAIGRRLQHGSTTFQGSFESHRPTFDSVSYRNDSNFMTLWQAVQGEAVKVDIYNETGSTNGRDDDSSIVALDLTGVEKYFAENTTSTPSTASWQTGASITFTPATAGTYLIIGFMQFEDAGDFAYMLGNVNRSGEATDDVTAQERILDVDATNGSAVGMLFAKEYSLGAVSQTFAIRHQEVEDAPVHNYSAIIAIRTSDLTDYASDFAALISSWTAGQFSDEINSASVSPGSARNVAFIHQFIFQATSNDQGFEVRSQVDGVDVPANRTANNWVFNMTEGASEDRLYTYAGAIADQTGATQFDVDYTNLNTRDIEQVQLAVFTRDAPGGGIFLGSLTIGDTADVAGDTLVGIISEGGPFVGTDVADVAGDSLAGTATAGSLTIGDTADVAGDTLVGTITAASVTATDTADVAADSLAGATTAGSLSLTDQADVGADTLAGTISAGSVTVTDTAETAADSVNGSIATGARVRHQTLGTSLLTQIFASPLQSVLVTDSANVGGDTLVGEIRLQSVAVADTSDLAGDTLTGEVRNTSMSFTDSADTAADTLSGTVEAGAVAVTDTSDVAGDTLSATIESGSILVTDTSDVAGDTLAGTISTGAVLETDVSDVAGDTLTGTIQLGSVTDTETADVAADTVTGTITVTGGGVALTDVSDVAGDTLVGTVELGSVVLGDTSDVAGDTVIGTITITGGGILISDGRADTAGDTLAASVRLGSLTLLDQADVASDTLAGTVGSGALTLTDVSDVAAASVAGGITAGSLTVTDQADVAADTVTGTITVTGGGVALSDTSNVAADTVVGVVQQGAVTASDVSDVAAASVAGTVIAVVVVSDSANVAGDTLVGTVELGDVVSTDTADVACSTANGTLLLSSLVLSDTVDVAADSVAGSIVVALAGAVSPALVEFAISTQRRVDFQISQRTEVDFNL